MSSPVLFLLTSSGLGGAERVALDAMKAIGKESTLVVLPSYGPLVEELEKFGFPYKILTYPMNFQKLSAANGIKVVQWLPGILGGALYFIKLLFFAKRNIHRTIYSHGLKAHVLAAILGKILKRKVVWHIHLYPPGGGLGKILSKLSSIPDVVIANSHSVKEACSKFSSRVEVVYCAIDEVNYRKVEKITENDKVVFKQPVTTVVGMVSVIAPWKGIELFINSVIPLVQENKDLCAVICGDEIYETSGHTGYLATLKALVSSHDLEARIKFIPFKRDVAPIYSQIDVLVHASLRPEPFGRVISEARLCGCAVIASDGGGAAEQVFHEKTGLLFPIGDKILLREAIHRLVEDRSMRQKLHENGELWIKENLGFKKFKDLVRKLVL